MADYTSEEDEHFFGAIGRLAISWAQIELGLDCAIDIIHRYFDGKKIDPDPPRTSLYRKTRYIRKWSDKIPESTFRNAAHQLMDQIEAASDVRHDVIHGVLIKQEEGTGEAEMVRLIHRATKAVDKKHFTVTSIDILGAAVDAGKLARRALHLGTEFQKLPAAIIEEIEKSKAELGG